MRPCETKDCSFYCEGWEFNCHNTALAGNLENCLKYHISKCYNRACNFYDESGTANCGNNILMYQVKKCSGYRPEEDAPERGYAEGVCKYDKKSRYYDQGGLETIDIIKKKLTKTEYKGFLKGNILKYICRMPHKGSEARDAEKVMHYARFLWEVLYG